jgi:hypothetical protein
MPINSGNKGKEYERLIAKKLSKWAGFELIRTPMSGAWQGTAGDIKPKHDTVDFPFTIECKKDENWRFEQIMVGNGPFYKWLEQAEREAVEDSQMTGQSKIPVVIFSRNYVDDFIAFPYYNYRLKPPMTIVNNGHFFYAVMTLDNFFIQFSYHNFHRLLSDVYWFSMPDWLVPYPPIDDPDI